MTARSNEGGVTQPITHVAATNTHQALVRALRGQEGRILTNAQIRDLYAAATGKAPSIVLGSDHHAHVQNRGRCRHCTEEPHPLFERIDRGRYRVLPQPEA